MSLKSFHLFFIAVAVLLCVGYGIWCLREAHQTGMAIASFAVAVALVVYEVMFLRRFKAR